jgi:hypothetical protein
VFFEGAFAPPFFPHCVAQRCLHIQIRMVQICLVDPPSFFDPLDIWVRHLRYVRDLPDGTLLKAELSEAAEEAGARRSDRH